MLFMRGAGRVWVDDLAFVGAEAARPSPECGDGDWKVPAPGAWEDATRPYDGYASSAGRFTACADPGRLPPPR